MKANNRSWQQKFASIKNIDPTLWQIYKITGTTNTKILILQDTSRNTILYTGNKKAEGLARIFEQVYLNVYYIYSPLQQEIECQASVISETPATQASSLSCSSGEIKKLIMKLPNNKAPGPPQNSKISLKNKPIVQLYYIYKACFKLSYFPTCWKITKIILIIKPGKPATSISSYRTISLLNILAKILEKIIHQHLLTHLDKTQTILPQFGFRHKYSYIRQLQRVTEHVITERNKNRTTHIVLLNFQQLLTLSGSYNQIACYKHLFTTAENHKQLHHQHHTNFIVSIDGTHSSTKNATAGVP